MGIKPDGIIKFYSAYDKQGDVISSRGEHSGGKIIGVNKTLIEQNPDNFLFDQRSRQTDQWLSIFTTVQVFRLKVLSDEGDYLLCELYSELPRHMEST